MKDINNLTIGQIADLIEAQEQLIQIQDDNMQRLRYLLNPNEYYRKEIDDAGDTLTQEHTAKVTVEEFLAFDIDVVKLQKYLDQGYFITRPKSTTDEA